ncbi:class I SAM-dependent methyltransferase [Solemya velum gill symbiont]|uniref:class I SAM-dependent methyltransferase n=1 Tax=Solemya velum gill symbiont TaxID=2340 RepID=UPI00099818EB|nr:class I SAM-dependent methyltransferase [Solemya velum gill symbiont]
MKIIKSILRSIPLIRYYLAGKKLLNDPYYQRDYLVGKKLLNDPYFQDGQEKCYSETLKTPKRTEIINFLLSNRNDETSYLEIGVRNPNDNFNHIVADEKYSVDPGLEYEENPADFKVTSDEFFELLSNNKILSSDIQFDVIFIDGLHLAEQVDRDIFNSMRFVKSDGFVVLHDCNPPTEWNARENYYYLNTPAGGYWNGTTWKAFLKWRFNPSVNSCCIDSDWGVGILSKEHPIGSCIREVNQFYEFRCLVEHKETYLNLISFDEFKKLLV